MPEISILHKHGLNEDDARDRIDALAGQISDRLGQTGSWQGDRAVCEAHGARARAGYDALSISLDVSLPRRIKPLRGKLETKIIEYFDRHFANSSMC